MKHANLNHAATNTEFTKLEPEDYCRLLHPPEGFGLPATLVKNHDDRVFTKLCEGSELANTLPVYQDATSYLSLNRFKGRRTNSGVTAFNALYVDLDFYNVGSLRGQSCEAVQDAFLDHLSANAVPVPNLLLHSGRGLGAIWLIDSLPQEAAPRWRATMQALLDLCVGFGADRSCSDEARVFRLPGTTNEKSGVEVGAFAGPLRRYSFDALSDAIFKSVGRPTRESLNRHRQRQAERGGSKAGTKAMPLGLSTAARFEIILKDLEAIRGHFGGSIPEGSRNIWLHIYATCLTHLHNLDRIEERITEVASIATPGLSPRELSAITTQALQKSKRAEGRYCYKGSTIAGLLGVTEALAKDLGLKQVIPARLKAARKNKARTDRRRANGGVSREEYLAANSASRDEPWLAMGISRATYYRRKAKGQLPDQQRPDRRQPDQQRPAAQRPDQQKQVRQVCPSVQGHHLDQCADPRNEEQIYIALRLFGPPQAEGARQTAARSAKGSLNESKEAEACCEPRSSADWTGRSLEPAHGVPGRILGERHVRLYR